MSQPVFLKRRNIIFLKKKTANIIDIKIINLYFFSRYYKVNAV